MRFVTLSCAVLLLGAGSPATGQPWRARLPAIVFHTERACANGRIGECGRGEIAVVNADGSRRKQLTHNNVDERQPAWSADHRSIAYARGPYRTASRIWVMNADGSGQHRLHLVARPSEGLYEPAWAPDGRRIVASVWTGSDFHLYVFDLRKGARTPLPPLGEQLSQEQSPEWSPDGGKITYAAIRGRGGIQIFVTTLRDGGWRQLTHCQAGDCTHPTWSSDGRRIAFQRGTNTIEVMRADGRHAQKILAGGTMVGNPSWSPTGDWITFAQPATADIYAVRASGNGLHRLTYSPRIRMNLEPDW